MFFIKSTIHQINPGKILIYNRSSLLPCPLSFSPTCIFLRKLVPKTSQTHPKHTPNIPQTYPKHVRKMPQTCQKKSENMSQTCQKSPKICPKYAPIVSEKCPKKMSQPWQKLPELATKKVLDTKKMRHIFLSRSESVANSKLSRRPYS